MDFKNKELLRCIERIFAFYKSETLIFLDCVLEDSDIDPEYSANTVINNLLDVMKFEVTVNSFAQISL